MPDAILSAEAGKEIRLLRPADRHRQEAVTRREGSAAYLAVGLLFALLVSCNVAWAEQPAPAAPRAGVVPAIAQNKDTQAAITPAIALKMLEDGNARFIIGSIEYGARVAGARLVVVLGHSDCGAIKGTCDGVQLGHLTGALAKIKPALDAVPDDGSPRNSKNYAFVQKVADMNVRLAVQEIRDRSPVLREMADKGEIAIVGAMLDVKTGKVTFYDGP